MTETQAKAKFAKSTIIPIIDDIYDFITWGEFAKEYFSDHSVSWFYNKMRGVDGNGGPGAFTQSELALLKKGLTDIADKIRNAAERI